MEKLAKCLIGICTGIFIALFISGIAVLVAIAVVSIAKAGLTVVSVVQGIVLFAAVLGWIGICLMIFHDSKNHRRMMF